MKKNVLVSTIGLLAIVIMLIMLPVSDKKLPMVDKVELMTLDDLHSTYSSNIHYVEQLQPSNFQYIYTINNGRRNYGIIDYERNRCIPPIFDWFHDANQPFFDDYEGFKKGRTAGFINRDGNIILQGNYEDATEYHDGYAIVSQDGKYGLIDAMANVVLPFEYDSISYKYDNYYSDQRHQKIFNEEANVRLNKNVVYLRQGRKLGWYIISDHHLVLSGDYRNIKFIDDVAMVEEYDQHTRYYYKDGTFLLATKGWMGQRLVTDNNDETVIIFKNTRSTEENDKGAFTLKNGEFTLIQPAIWQHIYYQNGQMVFYNKESMTWDQADQLATYPISTKMKNVDMSKYDYINLNNGHHIVFLPDQAIYLNENKDIIYEIKYDNLLAYNDNDFTLMKDDITSISLVNEQKLKIKSLRFRNESYKAYLVDKDTNQRQSIDYLWIENYDDYFLAASDDTIYIISTDGEIVQEVGKATNDFDQYGYRITIRKIEEVHPIYQTPLLEIINKNGRRLSVEDYIKLLQ